jgi:hypothetical protein
LPSLDAHGLTRGCFLSCSTDGCATHS